jgi:hypothetical protein
MRSTQKVKVAISAVASDALELEGRTMDRVLTVRVPGRLRVQRSH